MNQQQKDDVMFELIREMLRQQNEEERLFARKPVVTKPGAITRFVIKIKSFFRVLPADQL